jgi:hypothetical protein
MRTGNKSQTNTRRGLRIQLIVGLFIFVLAFGAAAWRLNQAPDIFTDEISYTRVGIRVAGEGAVNSDFGKPFLVHPPLYFLVEGAFLRLTSNLADFVHSPGNIFAEVYHARYLNAIFAGLTAVLLYWIGWRLRGPKLGLLLAVLFMLDPFGLRTNRRAMLETMAGMLVLAGMAVWLTDEAEDNRPSPVRAVISGLLFGAALLTKELAFTGIAAILLFGVWELRRGSRAVFLNAILTFVITSLTYALYPLWALVTGQWALFAPQKLLLLKRLIGLVQLNGWNKPGGASLPTLLLSRLSDYGTTYILFAAGAAVILWLLLFHRHDRTARLLGAWGLILCPFYGFVTLFGTASDQYFYYLLIPGIVLVGYTAVVWTEGIESFVSRHRLTHLALFRSRTWLHVGNLIVGCFLGLVVSYDLVQWWLACGVGVDNGYYQLTAYVQDNVPPGAPINASGDITKFQYFWPDRPITVDGTPQKAESQDVHYFVVAPKDIELHDSFLTASFAKWIASHGQLLFSVSGNSYGRIMLYRVDYASKAKPPQAKERTFPSSKSENVGSLLIEFAIWGLVVTGAIVWLNKRQARQSFTSAPARGVTKSLEAEGERA